MKCVRIFEKDWLVAFVASGSLFPFIFFRRVAFFLSLL